MQKCLKTNLLSQCIVCIDKVYEDMKGLQKLLEDIEKGKLVYQGNNSC